MNDVLVAIPITSAATLGITYLTRLWAREDNLRAERRREAAERREERMNERRRAVASVTDWLDVAEKVHTSYSVQKTLSKVYDANVSGMPRKVSRKELDNRLAYCLRGDSPITNDVFYPFFVAVGGAPTQEIKEAVVVVWVWTTNASMKIPGDRLPSDKLLRAIQRAREVVEGYIIEGKTEPRKVPSTVG